MFMLYKVTNISGGELVCDLAVQGKTLRLNNKQSTTIKENEITPHIKNLVKKGLVLIEEIPVETQTITKKTTTKGSNKEKEDK